MKVRPRESFIWSEGYVFTRIVLIPYHQACKKFSLKREDVCVVNTRSTGDELKLIK